MHALHSALFIVQVLKKMYIVLQRVLQMQQLERMPGAEAGGAEPDRPKLACHHLQLRAQPPVADPAQRARRLNKVSPRQEQQEQFLPAQPAEANRKSGPRSNHHRNRSQQHHYHHYHKHHQ